MIKLTKLEKPEVIELNQEAWTEEFLSALSNGNVSNTIRTRYRHSDIKSTIRRETSDKCAYCESKISHIHPGETDHIDPVSKRPELYVEWENLTYVCSECNREKSDYYEPNEPLVNPYSDFPDSHFYFCGPMLLQRDDKGFRTLKKLKLTRTSLIEKKAEKLRQFAILIQKWREKPEGPTKEFLKEEIEEYICDAAEYAATMRSFLAQEEEWQTD